MGTAHPLSFDITADQVKLCGEKTIILPYYKKELFLGQTRGKADGIEKNEKRKRPPSWNRWRALLCLKSNDNIVRKIFLQEVSPIEAFIRNRVKGILGVMLWETGYPYRYYAGKVSVP